MDSRELDPADVEPHGEVGDLTREQLGLPPPRAIPWEEAIEWTFAPMHEPD